MPQSLEHHWELSLLLELSKMDEETVDYQFSKRVEAGKELFWDFPLLYQVEESEKMVEAWRVWAVTRFFRPPFRIEESGMKDAEEMVGLLVSVSEQLWEFGEMGAVPWHLKGPK